jgi:hypothetical protein
MEMLEEFPGEMRRLPQWICWQLTDVTEGEGVRSEQSFRLTWTAEPAFILTVQVGLCCVSQLPESFALFLPSPTNLLFQSFS